MSHEGIHLLKPGHDDPDEMRRRQRETDTFGLVIAGLCLVGIGMCVAAVIVVFS